MSSSETSTAEINRHEWLDEMLVFGYIRLNLQTDETFATDLQRLIFDFFHQIYEILKWSTTYQSETGFALSDDDKCVQRVPSYPNGGGSDSYRYILADSKPVTEGQHCWRVKVHNPRSGWFVWGIAQQRKYENGKFVHKADGGGAYGVTYYQQFYPGDEHAVDRSVCGHFNSSKCEIDIYLDADEGTLKLCVVGQLDKGEPKMHKLPLETRLGWVPYFVFGTTPMDAKLRIARIPNECMAAQAPNKLMPTIPTSYGMVINNGKPRMRSVPNLDDMEGSKSTKTSSALQVHPAVLNYDNNANSPVSNAMIDFFHQCVIQRTLPVEKKQSENTDESQTAPDDNNEENENKSTWNWISSTFSSIFSQQNNNNDGKQYGGGYYYYGRGGYHRPLNIIERVFGNIYACTQQNVSSKDLKRYFRSDKRIDIEQAVGLIIALLNSHSEQLHNELILQLLKECGEIIFDSCMWLEGTHDTANGLTRAELKYQRFIGKFNKQYQEKTQHKAVAGLAEMELLLDILRRVRHSKSQHAKKNHRCLRIPDIIYDYCCMARPVEDEYDSEKPTYSWPMRPPSDDTIFIGRRGFNRLNNQLKYLQGKFGVGDELRRKIWKLRDNMKCANVTAITHTDDVLALCFSFLAFQRVSQLKIVSNLQSSEFLKKGESKIFFQNHPQQMSTFEQVLVDAALQQKERKPDIKALTAVVTPAEVFEYQRLNESKLEVDDGKAEGEGDGEDVGGEEHEEKGKLNIGWDWKQYVRYIDETALLMEEYIVTHANGEFAALCFKKGVRGGKRGPVDDYNLLCDIMKANVQRYKDSVEQFELNNKEMIGQLKNEDNGYYFYLKNVPQKNHKFLAKDIMAWNNAWKDDAFADGKRPDWLKWLQLRRKEGAVPPATVECY